MGNLEEIRSAVNLLLLFPDSVEWKVLLCPLLEIKEKNQNESPPRNKCR